MRVLIIGASVRAAAQSARRAGYEVVAADLFADRDLREIASCAPIVDYPQEFLQIRERFKNLPLLYTGALENHPALLAKLASMGPVYGNFGDALDAVRNPFRLASVFAKRGLAFPETVRSPPCPDDLDEWLIKLRSSAGGNHIQTWNKESQQPRRDHVFQKRLIGPPCSAAFVVSAADRRVRLLGATNMLVGSDWGATDAFTYCGSVAKNLSNSEALEWISIGEALSVAFGLRGLFGVDAITTADGIVPIEVNPRYTASMEVIEPSLHEPVIAYHIAACRGEALPEEMHAKFHPAAKLIVYATTPYIVPETLPSPSNPAVGLADLPTFGQTIKPGQPILTLLGDSIEALKEVDVS